MEAALDEARSLFILEPTIKVLHANDNDNEKHNVKAKAKTNTKAALDEARSIFILDPTIKVLHANHYNTKNDNYPELRTLNLTMFQVRIYLEAGTHTISFLQPGDSIQLLGPGIKSNKKRIHTNQMCQMMKEKEDVF